ncbi:MAG: TM2 domain-containing protein [Succinivibrio sp.]
MPKIIRIEGSTVTVGLDDGTFIESDISSCTDFEPKFGLVVDVYTSSDRVVITLRNQKVTGPLVPHTVDKSVYVIFAFIFGVFGIHKFYAGHTILGIIYLIFCWTTIPGYIGIVEAIIALTKKSDENGNIVV